MGFLTSLSWKFYAGAIAVVALITCLYIWRADIRRAAYDAVIADLVQQSNDDLRKQIADQQRDIAALEKSLKEIEVVEREAEAGSSEIDRAVQGQAAAPVMSDLMKALMKAIYEAQRRDAVRESTPPVTDVMAMVPAPKPFTEVDTAPVFSIQVGSHETRVEAERQARSIQGPGGELPRIEEALVGGKTWYRIKIGSYASKSDAVAACELVRAQGHRCLVT